MKLWVLGLRSKVRCVRTAVTIGCVRLCFLLTISLSVCHVSEAQFPGSEPAKGFSQDQIEIFDKAITSYMARNRVPGLSIAIGERGKLLWSAGFGLADIENYVPAKVETSYRFGSVSKPITATAVMQLAERGKLDLDAPIQNYCAAYPSKQWTVTARELLSHMGGVRDYRGNDQSNTFEEYTQHFTSVVEGLSVFKDDPLEYEPGTRYQYTSFGYNLLGCAVEGASGMQFMDYLKKNVLEPAGMLRTQQDSIFQIIPNRAQGYDSKEFPDGSLRNSPIIDNSYKLPGGGLCGTVEDLVRFGIAVQNGLLIRKDTLTKMETEQRTRDGKSTTYGLGWGVAEHNGHKIIHHYGGQARVTAVLLLLPDDGAIAILCNRQNAHIDGISERLYDMLTNGTVVPSM